MLYKIKLGRLILLLLIFSSINGQVVINEFMASNRIAAQDENGDYDDYIELYNPTEEPFTLSGYYLSDDLGNLNRWSFPEDDSLFTLAAGGYLVLWADGEPEQGLSHLPFSLRKAGEDIVVTGPDGQTIIDQISYENQRTDISMGRDYLDINSWSYFTSPTPGSENAVGYQGIAETPVIFPQGGNFIEPLSIFMTISDSSQSIHYTDTGHEPTENDPLYNSEISAPNTTVINAMGFKDDFIPSPSMSQFYLMNGSYSLPVLAVLTDPPNLWSDSTGIYANYLNEGPRWERRCTNQYFTMDSTKFSIASGIRIQGRSSRSRSKKSFRLFYRNAYDQDRLVYPVFGTAGPVTFKNLVLRSGYDDDIQMSTGTLIRDPLVSEIWEDLGMLTSRGDFLNLYLNDQYWGIYNIRESVNEHFISEHTGYNNFDLIRYLKYTVDLKHGSMDEWLSLNAFIHDSDFADNNNYEEALNRIDMDNFLNLQALIICSEYRSWVWGASVYRETTPMGKWRWTLWDMDRAFTNSNWNGFTFLNDTTGLEEPNAFALRFLQNDQFKVDFINRISDFLNAQFKAERVISKIDSLENLLIADIPFEAERWGRTISGWQNNIDLLRSFAENRPSIVRQQLVDYFSLAGEGEIVLNSSTGGHLKINSLSINDFPWNGSYFQGNPISVEAIPDPGYVFEGWNNAGLTESNPITINPTSDTSYLTAQFMPVDLMNSMTIITPDINEGDQFHPLVFRYYNSQGTLLMNSEPLIGDLMVNDSVLDSVVIIKKGVGTYLLNTSDLNGPISLTVQMNEELGNEIIIPQFIPTQTDTVSGSISLGETIWGSNSDIYIDGDLDIPSGANLLINAGAHINFSEHSNIVTHGTLNITGTKDNPVLFTSENWDQPWGGIEYYSSDSDIEYCFFINAGGDPDKGWQHTNRQPIIFGKENSNLSIINSFILYSPGKALGSHTSVLSVDSSVVSFVHHGGEFHYTNFTFNHSYMLNIPNDDGIFADTDNDGFHIDYRHPQITAPSRILNSFFITGKDDAIDHHSARVDVENCWIEGWMNEGVAASGSDTIKVSNTIAKNCANGFEAGHGSPKLIIDHSVAIENGRGFRFGDDYTTPSTGLIRVTNSIAFNNNDNIHNYTYHLHGPMPDGILLSYCITNDSEYDTTSINFTGVPNFKSNYRLHHYSIGASMGTEGTNLGLVAPSVLATGPVVINEIMYKASSAYDSGDWIELFNPNEDSLNVSSWMLKDDDDNHLFQFPESLIIPAKGYLIIANDLEAFQSVYTHEPQIIGEIPYGFGLGDQVRLYSSIMILADSLEYGVSNPWPSSPNNLGPSLELINVEDNSVAENWSASLIDGGTPGLQNSLLSVNILNEPDEIPQHFELSQNYPNPFNGQTLIQFVLPEETQIKIALFNILGREIRVLTDKTLAPGTYTVTWDGRDSQGHKVSTGVYFYRLDSPAFIDARKMVYLK
ncbi:MAG: T9SS type A sorting domain-containing protein [Candidatus Marinimicrobia bacterium]|jgi:uncharacterized repeat protein (TIGR02543 family)|nr:T9SS type A sorting domain-containing protein [Candidatus Neomarinimicrobiota bacterium]MBT4359590.1 T9SS type A sorting domain-containing protein [Candidatus Neomarinimicrobiota bacterium]MBT4713208.1 T9SS type A sorting domain-containing protein [Candidatus Neomarinimicrobiota bacterium]MBT4944561.1 T9SS type A sorting domain-containing protein [Candidatus Neomarinimicrobiota bacterium]MBT5269119.1 T9SS type A sorting domain-containing protein [Candidatus Neomarinimicrobiota bacterium]